MSDYKQFKHLIIIGGQRCGTTYVVNLLKKFSNFKLTKEIFPEPKYFLNRNLDYNYYLNNFFEYSNNDINKIFVEKSTTYCERPKSIKTINKVLDDVQIFMIIRDPIKRAISNYNFS